MKNIIVNPLFAFIILVILNFTFCKNAKTPANKKFNIISEIESNKKSPFYIDIKKYPKERKALPIGVFDSGTGGLAVLNAIFELDRFNNSTHTVENDGIPDFSKERFIYLADEANMPYGKYNAEGKADFLRELIIKDICFLLDKEFYLSPYDTIPNDNKEPVKAIVIACNTATAYGLQTIKEAIKKWKLEIPVFGIVDAGSRNALNLMNPEEIDNSIIGILATEGTCSSNGYPTAIAKNAEQKYPGHNINIIQQPGIGLAGAIDGDIDYINSTAITTRKENQYKGPKLNDSLYPIDTALWIAYNFNNGNELLTKADNKGTLINVQLNSIINYIKYAVTHLIENAVKNDPDKVLNSVILGCTHYPYVENEIRNHIMFLKNLNIKYNKVISDKIYLIDPAESLAHELYTHLIKNNQWGNNSYANSEFYISVPNPILITSQINNNWEFPYTYKYGRSINSSEQYVKIVPFSDKWINSNIKQRLKQDIPATYNIIYKNQNTLKYKKPISNQL